MEERPVLIKGLRSIQLIYRGFRYVRNRTVKDSTYWRCEDKSCSGKLTTKNEALEVSNAGDHNHDPKEDDCEIKRLRSETLTKALASPSLPSNEVSIVT